MAEIYVPIDFSDICKSIPHGEDIIYSTLCQGFATGGRVNTFKWISHVLMTAKGVAYTVPMSGTLIQVYQHWEKIFGIVSSGRLGTGFAPSRLLTFKLVSDENFETKKKFLERSKKFAAKFRPISIKRKEEWLEINQSNQELKKQIKSVEKSLNNMRIKEKKRLAKEAKKIT